MMVLLYWFSEVDKCLCRTARQQGPHAGFGLDFEVVRMGTLGEDGVVVVGDAITQRFAEIGRLLNMP